MACRQQIHQLLSVSKVTTGVRAPELSVCRELIVSHSQFVPCQITAISGHAQLQQVPSSGAEVCVHACMQADESIRRCVEHLDTWWFECDSCPVWYLTTRQNQVRHRQVNLLWQKVIRARGRFAETCGQTRLPFANWVRSTNDKSRQCPFVSIFLYNRTPNVKTDIKYDQCKILLLITCEREDIGKIDWFFLWNH